MMSQNKDVFVIGDVMLDCYWDGSIHRISPEAPIPILNHEETFYRLGGAANVAKNLECLSLSTRLFGLVGDDISGQKLQQLIGQSNIKPELLNVCAKTIQKLRISGRNQQIVRVDFEDQFNTDSSYSLSQHCIDQLDECSLIILSDYGKGTLQHVEMLIAEAKTRNIPILVDPKGANYEKYRNANFLTPNKLEFERVIGRKLDGSDLEVEGEKLRQNLNLNTLIVTLSDKGMIVFDQDGSFSRIPGIKRSVVDVTGAGDTVIAWLAYGFLKGWKIIEAAQKANIAGSISVTRLGTNAASIDEVLLQENANLTEHASVELQGFLDRCRTNAEKIVFTNGCFDILHEGHVHLLAEAKKLGNRLIVGVNDDDSVKLLKGHGRPVNPISSRKKILDALSSVDFVVAFSEATPINLIKAIKPDVLVKGGDYLQSQVVGAEHVLQLGGEVKIIDFVEGFSTSDIITKFDGRSDE